MLFVFLILFASSCTPAFGSINYRLPKSLIPIQYNITFIPYLTGKFLFDGSVTIKFKVVEATKNITLHNDGLQVHSLAVRGGKGDVTRIVTKTAENDKTNFFVISLDREMEKGENYTLSMNYTGNIREDMTGIYKSVYNTPNNEKKVMLTTQFEATNARRAFPCFDEAWMKARFAITISRPANMESNSNMPQEGHPVKHMDSKDGVERYWDRYMVTPPMSTYIVAFFISNFANLSDPHANVRVFARRSIIAEAQYSLDICKQMISWFSEYTAMNFVLPKMDLVAIPDFGTAAMENWGIVHFRERMLLTEQGVTTTEAKQKMTSTLAHEVAHQWFGDLVTPAWWSDTWLSEGFAEFYGYFATATVFPSWKMNEQFAVNILHPVMVVDSFDTSHPLSWEIDGSHEAVDDVFDDISYSKGAVMVNMMMHMLTPKAFQEGIRRYVKQRSYDVATPEFLFSIFNDEFKDFQQKDGGDLDFTTVMKTWTNQMSYPVIKVVRDYSSFTASIVQKPFILKDSFQRTGSAPAWYVPLSFTTQRALDFTLNQRTKLWMKPQQPLEIKTTASKDEWMLFNIHQTGYYRVNYDPKNWQLLSAYLNSDNYALITPVNRAQLIDDSFNIARAGLINYCIPLALTRYLKRETDLVPIMAFVKNFRFIKDRLSFSPDIYLQEYILHLMAPIYNRIGFEEGKDDDHVTKITRATIVEFACDIGHSQCLQQAVRLFNQSMTLAVTVAPDLQKSVYCSALQQGGNKEWDYLWKMYQETSSPALQSLIIEVLCCSTDVNTLKHYLQMSVERSSPVRAQDAYAVFHHLLNRRSDVVLDFFINNYQAMEKQYGEMNNFAIMLGKVSSIINTKEQILKLKEFFTKRDFRESPGKDAVSRAITKVDETLNWQKTRGKEILTWLKNKNNLEDKSFSCNSNEPQSRTRGSKSSSSANTTPSTTVNSSVDIRSLVINIVIGYAMSYSMC